MLHQWFEDRIRPTARADAGSPPATLLAFYWHFLRQARGLCVAMVVVGGLQALLDASIPAFLGRVVTLATRHGPGSLFHDAWPQLLLMAGVLLFLRPAAIGLRLTVVNLAITPGMTNLVRWQSHWHVVRQAVSFFQNDFAGRIAQRVMQTGPSLRESVVSASNAVWYIAVYGGIAAVLLASNDLVLAAPIFVWAVGYVLLLRRCVPRMRDRSRRMSEVRSLLTGRIVDSYTNILTVKLFARAEHEDAYVREAVDWHGAAYHDQTRMITGVLFTLQLMNALMITATGALALWLWSRGTVDIGAVAMALPLAWQVANISTWVSQDVTGIFENIGTVQDGMNSISPPITMADPPGATPLPRPRGDIRFDRVRFGYGTERGVLHGLDLHIQPGERVGLVGHSGAGKSTLINLLLRFHEPESGRVLVDGRDLAGVTGESLRQAVGVVTQDTSLLHRSILDNIRYGRPDATEAEVRAAAARAHALEFIETLEDWQGRRGFAAHVGERGVKLSGGQRQRIAIARVFLKDAPILVLDEATSALDSEVEAAIQEQLVALMQNRTVIAVAHRLSTLSVMDRLVVLDHGRVAEQGTHAALLATGGAYARLWRRQSGGFMPEAEPGASSGASPGTDGGSRILDTAVTPG